MKSEKIKIECMGMLYIFKTSTIMRQVDLQKLRDNIMQQLKEGCVLLPADVELVDVEPILKPFAE